MQNSRDFDFSKYMKVSSQNGVQVSAACPFHKDSTPSFSGNVENGLWTCFQCGRKGNWWQLLKMLNVFNVKDRKGN